MFEYDASLPLDVQVRAIRRRRSAEISDLSFASPVKGRVTAFLVMPRGEGPFPAVLFLHWGFGDRTSFLSEAQAYASAGIAALLVDAPGMGARGGRMPRLDDAAFASSFLRQMVLELRRGLDLLCSSDSIDPERLAFVGHSLGGSVAGQLAGSDPRVRLVVIMAGNAEVSQGWPMVPSEEYAAALAPMDATAWIGQSQASFLLQFATEDAFVTEESAERYADMTPRPKRVEWYECEHALDKAALEDRAFWLADRLGVEPPAGWIRGVKLPLGQRIKFVIGQALYGMARERALRKRALRP